MVRFERVGFVLSIVRFEEVRFVWVTVRLFPARSNAVMLNNTSLATFGDVHCICGIQDCDFCAREIFVCSNRDV